MDLTSSTPVRPPAAASRSSAAAHRPPAAASRAIALLLAAAAGGVLPGGAAGQIGVLGGFNRESLGDLPPPSETLEFVEDVDGFHAGILLDLRIGRIGFRPAIIYRHLAEAAFVGEERNSADIQIVEFPLDIRVSAPTPVLQPYLVAGAVAMFPSSAREAVDLALVGSQVRLDVGVGLEWSVGFRLWPELRLGRGLGSLLTSGGGSFETFTVRLGVGF